MAKRGYNKKLRFDLNQGSYYIAANYDYILLFWNSYAGNICDSRTFSEMITCFQWNYRSVLFQQIICRIFVDNYSCTVRRSCFLSLRRREKIFILNGKISYYMNVENRQVMNKLWDNITSGTVPCSLLSSPGWCASGSCTA